jgi:hypothetical protein
VIRPVEKVLFKIKVWRIRSKLPSQRRRLIENIRKASKQHKPSKRLQAELIEQTNADLRKGLRK